MSGRNSMLCPNCRKLISIDEKSCPYCGLSAPGSRWKTGILNKLFSGNVDAVKALITINVAYYILSLILNPFLLQATANPFAFLSPSPHSLFLLGASGTIPIINDGHWWSVLSAPFLHGGLLHLFFNMFALWQMGYFLLREFGFSRFIAIYLITGVAGFLASFMAGTPFTIGASAGICGFIGAIIYYGKSRGGFYGDMIYRQSLGWVVGLVIFGFIIPGIDNWAHGGGLLTGILLGHLLGYQDKKQETYFHKILAITCMTVTAAALAWAAFSAVSIIFS